MPADSSGDRGFATVQYVVAACFSLVLLVLAANLLLDLYARGALRDALDEATRADARAGAAVGTCESKAASVVHDLAPGSLVHVDELQCGRVLGTSFATARVRLRSWLPLLVPDWRIELRASALREE